jgi:hypothetical protein
MMQMVDDFWKMGMQKLKKCASEPVERVNQALLDGAGPRLNEYDRALFHSSF